MKDFTNKPVNDYGYGGLREEKEISDFSLIMVLLYLYYQNGTINNGIEEENIAIHRLNPVISDIAKLASDLDKARLRVGYYNNPEGYTMNTIREVETLVLIGSYLSGDPSDDTLIAKPVWDKLTEAYSVGLDRELFNLAELRKVYAQNLPEFKTGMAAIDQQLDQYLESNNYLHMLYDLLSYRVEEIVLSRYVGGPSQGG